MRHAGKVAALSLALLLPEGAPALAIQNGPADNGNHPTVGMAYIATGTTCNINTVTTGCGVVLISDDSGGYAVGLTTADCALAIRDTYQAYVDSGYYSDVSAWVGFNGPDPWACDSDPGDPSAHLNALKVHFPVEVHPNYTANNGSSRDKYNVGIVKLELRSAVSLPAPSALPAADSVPSIPAGTPIVSVGFSPTNLDYQQGSNGQFGKRYYNVFQTARRATVGESVANSQWTHVTQITDDQSCYAFFADDGGGNFSTSGQLVSLMSTFSSCGKTEAGQRIDRADILSFVQGFLP